MDGKRDLTTGNVGNVIMSMTYPMIFGMLSIVIFNLVDTYFVSKLGTEQLAALSFAYPVVLVINSISLGLGIGASSVVARTIGEGNNHKVRRYATDSLVLSAVIVFICSFIGLISIDEVFSFMGADGIVLMYIKEYMSIWYLGTVFVLIPMVGNSIIRSLGDTKTPGYIMFVAAIVNSVLDPFLIFGIAPFPAMGIRGAAIATVFSRMITFIVALYVLIWRDKIIDFRIAKTYEILESWKKVLYVGLPNAFTRVITPVATGIFTGLIARFGYEAVAGYGVAIKIEFFALAFVHAMASIMTPFAGQNYGANRFDRVKEGLKYSGKISLYYGIAAWIFFIFSAPWIATLFNGDVRVASTAVGYLRLVPLAYGFYGILLCGISVLNAVNRPLSAALISMIQMFVIAIPLALIGGKLYGVNGIFGAIAISYLMAGVLAYGWVRYMVKREERLYEEYRKTNRKV